MRGKVTALIHDKQFTDWYFVEMRDNTGETSRIHVRKEFVEYQNLFEELVGTEAEMMVAIAGENERYPYDIVKESINHDILIEGLSKKDGGIIVEESIGMGNPSEI